MTFPEWCTIMLCIAFYLIGWTARGMMERFHKWMKPEPPEWMP